MCCVLAPGLLQDKEYQSMSSKLKGKLTEKMRYRPTYVVFGIFLRTLPYHLEIPKTPTIKYIII